LWCYNTFVKEVNYADLYTSFKFLKEENEMKRKIAILLAAVMTTAMLPMNVMASSSNSVNKRVTVKNDDPIGSDWADENETRVIASEDEDTSGSSYKPVYLKILPQTGIDKGSSILISIENGKFDKSVFPMPTYTSGTGNTYDQMMASLNSGMTQEQVLSANLGVYTNELPYKVVSVSKREIEVELFPVDEKYCDKTGTAIASDKPYYYIPIHALADGTGDVKITIDDNETNVSGGGTYTIATSSDDDGSTTTTIDDLTTFRDADYMETITIKENVKDTFEAGETVTLRLSSGFNFVEDSKTKITLTGSTYSITLTANYEKDDKLTFTLPKSGDADYDTFKAMKGATARIKIENLKIEADDEDDDWGDVKLTVSGAGLTKETIQIGTRADYGFKMTAVDSATTILSGRTWLVNDDLEDDDFETATIKFEETNAGSWLTSRKMKFTVPEGVKIVDYDYDNVKYVSKSDLEDASTITTDGTVLSLLNKDMSVDDGECAEFELTLYVSVDADFAGDITVGVSGAGIEDESTLDDVVVAQAVTPIKIESAVTKSNMGYQAVNTADITITEAEAGALLDGEDVSVAIDSLYGAKELGFADDGIDYDIEGEVEIKSFNVDDGEITFKIDKDSYNEPSSITINNVKVGSTRSVPVGNYDIKVSGDAVINNYDDDVDDIYPTVGYSFSTSDKEVDDDIALFDTTDGYNFDDYLQIVTETGTLDSVVEVTIGESTIKMDGEDVQMDVAPYIQASSNSTMVPLRFVSLAIGVDTENASSADESSKVMWDANSKTATVLYAAGNGQKIIQFTAGSNIMVIDGSSIPMENGVVAEITDSRMFVPFRALGQALGVPVTWDADTRTAIYNQK
jgi:hypothetical protein